MINKITVGVFGAGRIGQVHIRAMQRNHNVIIKTVVDPFMNEELASTLQDFGVLHTSVNIEDIFEDDDIQAVFICSPTDTHSDYSLRAIHANKHVFCEKPVDMKLSRIKEVMSALENSEVQYQVGFNRRFDHNFSAVQQAIQDNKIGTPQMIRITSRDPAPPPIEYIKVSGGLFFDMMIHDFDIMRFQTGAEVEEVYAVGSVLVDSAIGDAGDIDSAIVTCKMSNGMIGYIEKL